MTFTASGFDRAVGCPGSFALPQANTTNQYADRGNDGHAAICAFVSQVREGVSIDAAILNAPEEWQEACEELAPYAPHLVPEAAFGLCVSDVGATRVDFLGSDIGRAYDRSPGWVYGTADLAGLVGGEAIVIDVKTGWTEVAHPERNLQLRLLACMVASYYGVGSARVLILRCPEGQNPRWIAGRLDALDLDETEALARRTHQEIQCQQILAIAPSVAEGAWCRYCPATPYCPAKTALIRRLATGDETTELDMMVPLDKRTAGIAWERLRVARSMLKRIEGACHAFLAEHGEIELPSGKLLRKVEEAGNERIDGERAYEMLRSFNHHQLDGVAEKAFARTVTKKALGVALREEFGRGGAEKERQLLEEMRSRGIITRAVTSKIVEVDP